MIRGGYWGGAWGLSWAGAWGEAWLLLNQPYQELSLKGQVFVRSYLTRIHSVEVVEQIVSVAAVNNISVVEAEVAVTTKHTAVPVEAVRLSVIRKVAQSTQKPAAIQPLKRDQKPSISAMFRQPSILAKAIQSEIAASSQAQSVNIISNQFSIAWTYKADQRWQPSRTAVKSIYQPIREFDHG